MSASTQASSSVRSSARKLKAHAYNTRNDRSCRYTFSTSPQQQSGSGATENAILPPSTAGLCPLWVIRVIPEVPLAPPLRGFWTGLRGIHRNFAADCCQASGGLGTECHEIPFRPWRHEQAHCHPGCSENKTMERLGPEWAQKVLSQEMVLDERRWACRARTAALAGKASC